MVAIVELVDDVISNFEDESNLETVKNKVNALMKDKPLFV